DHHCISQLECLLLRPSPHAGILHYRHRESTLITKIFQNSVRRVLVWKAGLTKVPSSPAGSIGLA
ncbi:MAG: hypothetical protein ACK6EB_26630, partial [Planctomyces sp.]